MWPRNRATFTPFNRFSNSYRLQDPHAVAGVRFTSEKIDQLITSTVCVERSPTAQPEGNFPKQRGANEGTDRFCRLYRVFVK